MNLRKNNSIFLFLSSIYPKSPMKRAVDSKTKTVWFMVTGLHTGGAEIMLYVLLAKIDRKRFNPVVISLVGEGNVGTKIRELDIPVYPLNLKKGLASIGGIFTLFSCLFKHPPDLIQGWMYHGNLIAQFLSFVNFNKIPVVWSIHHSLDSIDNEKFTLSLIIQTLSFLSRFPRKIQYVSKTGADQHEKIGYHSRNRQIIPNGFDTRKFIPNPENKVSLRQELNLDDRLVLIGLLCRFHPMKDHANFCRAARILLDRFPDVNFVLAGRGVDGNNEDLQALLQKFDLLDHCHLLGERQDMEYIISGLDILTTSSAYGEAFPLVIGEAMSCGVPCVATDVGDSAWIVGNTGKVVPPRDPERLARGWQDIIELDLEKRSRLGGLARERIVRDFSIEKIADEYNDLYDKILSAVNP
ncbi:glycosyltransferase [Pannus brasiliensis CCIBt3594]|uniref:Glycosyltransferase n=1 Tax=Pannus brasiliensis CCIBt3594 TaxID=1427578 RepID=A0AAW9QUU0_9CHRO